MGTKAVDNKEIVRDWKIITLVEVEIGSNMISIL